MRRRTSRISIGIVAALVMFIVYDATCSGEPAGQWGPFSGNVVDIQTGQPIPGAVFVVSWTRAIPMPLHPGEHFYDARVAVADAAGRFETPRRPRPWSFSGLVDPPSLSCIAPGYEPYRGDGAQNAPITVKLRPLTAEERRPGRSGSTEHTLVTIPFAIGREFERTINLKRQEMGLPPVDFYTGTIERALR